MIEDKFYAGGLGLGELLFSVGVLVMFERLDGFKNGESGVQGGVIGTGAIALAVEGTIGHFLGEDKIDNRF